MVKIAPSILSADFSKLGDDVRMLEKAGADWIHFDVMDGHFVPNISYGPLVLKAIRPCTALPLDVHLMVDQPSLWIDPFIEAGADCISLHVEAEHHMERQLARIRAAKKKAGLVLNPATPLSTLEYSLGSCDFVLLMSVNPGFGGQKFLELTYKKIGDLRSMAVQQGTEIDIQVDGGVDKGTARRCIEAGATILVAGSSVFGAPDPKERIAQLKGLTQ